MHDIADDLDKSLEECVPWARRHRCRMINGCNSANIKTLGQLLDTPLGKLLNIKNVGKVGLKWLHDELLHKYGVGLERRTTPLPKYAGDWLCTQPAELLYLFGSPGHPKYTGQEWQLCVRHGPTGDWLPVAQCSNLPVPEVGDTVFHEAINGPLTVVKRVWTLRGGYPLMCDVQAE